jgi:hypothetical protein
VALNNDNPNPYSRKQTIALNKIKQNNTSFFLSCQKPEVLKHVLSQFIHKDL